jgi:magnesium chelatase family protein
MGAKEIKRYCAVKEDADKLLETAINKLGLSARAYSRVLKVGRTIADLAEAENAAANNIELANSGRSRTLPRGALVYAYFDFFNPSRIFSAVIGRLFILTPMAS